MPGLDAARFIGAAGIVWLHTLQINPHYGWLGEAGRFAVPFFTFAAIVMLGESLRVPRLKTATPRTFSKYLNSRFTRIYIPFLVWTVLYYVWRSAKHFLLHGNSDITL